MELFHDNVIRSGCDNRVCVAIVAWVDWVKLCNGATPVQLWFYCDVTVLLLWCYSDVTVVLQNTCLP